MEFLLRSRLFILALLFLAPSFLPYPTFCWLGVVMLYLIADDSNTPSSPAGTCNVPCLRLEVGYNNTITKYIVQYRETKKANGYGLYYLMSPTCIACHNSNNSILHNIHHILKISQRTSFFYKSKTNL